MITRFTEFFERHVSAPNPREPMPSDAERNKYALKCAGMWAILAAIVVAAVFLIGCGCYSASVQDFIIRANEAVANSPTPY